MTTRGRGRRKGGCYREGVEGRCYREGRVEGRVEGRRGACR